VKQGEGRRVRWKGEEKERKTSEEKRRRKIGGEEKVECKKSDTRRVKKNRQEEIQRLSPRNGNALFMKKHERISIYTLRSRR
jgi:hypothetical protein